MFSTIRSIRRVIFIASAASLGACASVPADPDLARTFVPVQAHQTQDLSMGCDEIGRAVHEAEYAVAALDKQIKYDQEQSQSFSMAAAFSGVSGMLANNPLSAQLANANATLGNAGASMSDRQAMTKTQLRANLEQRHDALMQIYFARQCKST